MFACICGILLPTGTSYTQEKCVQLAGQVNSLYLSAGISTVYNFSCIGVQPHLLATAAQFSSAADGIRFLTNFNNAGE
jgi:hypothetical protein